MRLYTVTLKVEADDEDCAWEAIVADATGDRLAEDMARVVYSTGLVEEAPIDELADEAPEVPGWDERTWDGEPLWAFHPDNAKGA